MALDTGRLTETPTLADGQDVGEALRRIRLHRGLELEDIAATTRVRRIYLAAIENLKIDALPSRPFTIGYIRAYATALGVSPDTAVERFRAERPAMDEPLRAPIGVNKTADPRVVFIAIGVCLVLGAILTWNIVQRATNAPAEKPKAAVAARPATAMPAAGPQGPLALGAPLPAPMESTTPTPYETPGLSSAVAGANGLTTLDEAPADLATQSARAAAAQPQIRLSPSFKADGPVYGAPDQASAIVTIQALKPAPLVVRSHSGAVYFARQLAKGEAYRAPPLPGVVVEAADPHAFQVFIAGQSRGLLSQARSELKSLAVAP